MTRLAGITVYAMVAALVLVAPLSASEEPAPPDPAAPEAVPPDAAPAEPAPAEATPPETAPPPADAPPPEAAAGTPPPEAAPAPAPAAPVPAAEPVPEETVVTAEEPSQKKKRNRGDRPVRAKAAASASVSIRDFEFAPGSVTIDAGDTVTWNNQGPTPHSATADNGSFDTGILDDGQSGSHTFDQAGTFSYFCTPHPNMRGTITVRAASAGGSGGDTAGDGGTADTAGTEADTGPTLAATGLDAGGLAALGVATLMLGVWLRRRAAPAG
jgi:plastocyanin